MELGNTYLLRMINAGLEDPVSFAVAKHELTIVGVDGSYTKPLTKAHSSATDVYDDNTTTTAIVQYEGLYPSSKTPLPNLPSYDDTKASVNFLQNLTTSDT
ncbi:hypothetical protein KPL70_016275 [Citrus sinensis]|nr:hypothetical protein KPL70_016275 [Citrus sinensis]